MVTGSSHSINICPPHSPTRITKNSILKLAGVFHRPNTSRIRFWAFSYSMGEPCGRSNQLITYFIVSPFRTSGRSQIVRILRSTRNEPSLDYLVRSLQHRRRDAEPEGLGSLRTDEELELGRQLDGYICGFGAPENPVDLGSHARPVLTVHRSITH